MTGPEQRRQGGVALGQPGPGQAWAVLSPGPEARRQLRGELQRVAGARFGWLSHESQQAFYESELRHDDTDFSDRPDPGTSGLGVLLGSGASEVHARRRAREAGLDAILDRGYRLLSTGESRLLLLLREVLAGPDLLLLEQPFEGLDASWRASANRLLTELVAGGGRLVTLVERAEDAPDCSTHHALLRDGRAPLLTAAVPAACGAPTLSPELAQLLHLDRREIPSLPEAPGVASELPDPLVRLRDCSVSYHLPGGSRVTQFRGLDWQLRRGEHTLVTGPNGAGKSTLLQLLSGDHPQCYANDVWVLGHRRGSGESIWDIKKHVGLVSPALHRDYRARGNLLSVVVSGLYDSIGVYRDVPEPDRRLALCWLDAIGLGDSAAARFDSLSFGQQRLVLIARGLIKHPPLLILDEPTQGLDELGRQLVLAFVEQLAGLERTTLLVVTHRQDEHLALFRRRLTFAVASEPGVRFRVEVT